ncbi:hypothetical protein [Chryseobacterium lacus]|uniref:hypothetical protein n=1 Tax=Chryseobacterium lacus TaxID=2058346 RepID=UPI000F88A69E|nr:hypothetical protein [Chryseobacterium lacus]RST27568.1 hypothetical protein EIZ46_04455 [Chryseobacterium lacus]
MKSLLFIFIFLSIFFHSQSYEVKSQELVKYFDNIRLAENAILENQPHIAHSFYKKSFSINQRPFAKDLYNSMLNAKKLGIFEYAYDKYSALKCLQYPFTADFVKNNFPKKYGKRKEKCKNNLDITYKKQLDSLFELDQYYRKLAEGNLMNKKKEITESDSITSTTLLKLIEQKGFPSEYDIGLSSINSSLMQNFYLIIWHQMAMNHVSTQKVNFSQKLIEALNNGKILPEHASFLIDLNNGTSDFWLRHFTVFGFLTDNGTGESIRDQIFNETSKKDCCYIHNYYKSETRDTEFEKTINKVNNNRKKLGLSSLEETVKFSVFSLDNNDYIFPQKMIEMSFVFTEEQIKMQKAPLIKIP